MPAYQAGATGSGVTVAVIDTGINPNLSEFAGQLHPASQDVAANRGISDTNGHGTMVSGVIAANRNGSYMQGVAYDATILSLNVGDPAGCQPGNDCFLDSAIPTAVDLARTNNADVINMSFGDEEGLTPAIYPAIGLAVDAGIIIVMASGNDGGAAPNSFALTNIQNEGASGLLIIAGAMDSNRNIAGFSNRAGTGPAANWFLTALGVGNATINHLGAHVNPNGTSFSTPTVVGAAALLMDAFPNLTGPQVVNLLLTTADDAGAPGTDAIFGRGILNIGRAFQPQGATTLAASATAISLTTNGTLSGAMGDASPPAGAVILDGYSRAYILDLGKTLKGAAQDLPLADAMSGGSYHSAAGSAGPVSLSMTMRRNLTGDLPDALDPNWRGFEDSEENRLVAATAISRLTPKTSVGFGLSQSARVLQRQLAGDDDNAFLVARDPTIRTGFRPLDATSFGLRHDFGFGGVTVTSEHGDILEFGRPDVRGRPDYAIRSISLDRTVGPGRFSVGASQLKESDTVLGGRFASAFGAGGSETSFLDGNARFSLGSGWKALASYRRGWTSLKGIGGLVDRGRLVSQAFAADVSRSGVFQSGDMVAVRVMQPLRVIGGGLDLNIPATYDYATGLAGYEQRFFALSPKGREIDYEVAYGWGVLGGYLDLNAFYRTDPGHVEAIRSDIGAAVRFTLSN